MTTCKGIVKNNTVVLQEGADLPEGAEVEVRLVESPVSRDELFERVRANRIRRFVGIDEIIAEAKQELEERPDQWLQ